MPESAGAALQNAHRNPMNINPPKIRRIVQKIRRLAASLGIESDAPMDDAASGVTSMVRHT